MAASCGTRAGYLRHRKAGEDACEPCKKAERVYQKARYELKRKPSRPPSTCAIEGCNRKHTAHGMCSSHYSAWHREQKGRQYRTWSKTCESCGEPFQASHKEGKFCSQLCFVYERFGPQVCKWSPPKPRRPQPEPFLETRECAWCGDKFTTNRRAQVFCSIKHKRKAGAVRRRGLEHGLSSHFTWTEVIHLWLRFEKRCAYCECAMEVQPDPDHVVPLSRGGSNSITNILPCCSPCNSDKRDLLLSEWNQDRERRGLELRTVAWDFADPRVVHLTSILVA